MKKTHSRKQDFHSDWLSQVDIDGPFLALPVLKDMWKDGVDRLGDTDDRLLTFKQAFARWQRALDRFTAEPRTPESKAAYAEVNGAWIDTVLDQIAEWDGLRTNLDVSVQSPGEQVTVAASGGLAGRDGETAAVFLICEPTSGGLRETGLDGWPANGVDRLAMLLRKAGVEVGIVTDGQWWALVSAKDGKPTGSGMFNALTWAEEPLLRDAFFTLVNQRRFRTQNVEHRLTRLFERSELEAETVTEKLGTQVRKSVELLVQAFSEERLKAARNGDPDPLTEKPDDVYQAAVTVMMRIVFLLFAEERDMLPTEQLYWDSYAIKDLLTDLQSQAVGGEEHLDETFDAWHRLLAVSNALHGGVNYDEMRMPAYGGSLLDPERFPWLHAVDERGLRLRVSDRVMMHVLESVQTVVTGGERRRISFREVDVEQIGYIYEGLLGYSCSEVTDDIVLGLVGKDGEEPEIPLGTLNELWNEHGGDPKKVAAALVAWTKEHQPAATSKTTAALARLISKEPTADERAELVRLLTPVAGGDANLLETLVGWGNVIRRDLRNIPLVFPIGGLVVIETPSRKNAGAHYTPRSLAEEVVLHALQPLVYEPGPLQTSDESDWKLRSVAEILDLKVADIAAGSGAFLVAAARYLAERVVEAWTCEHLLSNSDLADPDEVKRRALREVIARCLYGADINPMAVEMCKLSLWLVSMDRTKPFSFVDDKIFCGNSLLGLTDLDQLRYLHVYPEPTRMHQQLLVNIDDHIEEATQLRHELANPVEEHNPMRSSQAKRRLLMEVRKATENLRLIANGVVAAGLPLGGKPGRQLDDAYTSLSWQVQEAFPADGSLGRADSLNARIQIGLTPTVATDYERWVPLHWVIETPDVILENKGFDAVIGNPPFLGAKKLSNAVGIEMRTWLVNTVAHHVNGNADQVAYFILRNCSLLKPGGCAGLVVTDTAAQGDTREVGLNQLIDTKMPIFRAVRSTPWPKGSTGIDIAKLWITRTHQDQLPVQRWLDGRPVKSISSLLEPERRATGDPKPLKRPRLRAFVGANPNGLGFLMEREAAEELLRRKESLSRILRPYLCGEDLVSTPDSSATRFIVDTFGMKIDSLRAHPELYDHLLANLWPYRQTLTKKPKLQERWWEFERPARALRDAISCQAATEVVALARISKHLQPTLVSADQVFMEKVVVFVGEAPLSVFAALSSTPHFLWGATLSATMGTRIAYKPSDAAETFVPPATTQRMLRAAQLVLDARSPLSTVGLGLTKMYNLFHDITCEDDSVEALRRAHLELNAAVLEAYGWTDLDPAHEFGEFRGMKVLTVPPAVRSEILDRLLDLNLKWADIEEREPIDQELLSDREEQLLL
ncbi:Eco57I restriction-modification methylase domain-containing protein [Gordonia alkanivorans]|uniref:Eco57I restriction-modification methylase domain-containing protein n=1 Tax=Gordonia alkanivorans TaxID=84096 RepID=UPI002447082C|nr:type IIL restriction-modification enzyme MmeI [Gordonia alkanivorans]MDH3006751.1 SAM-dependent DNA methyltransferase [Gordonia alkanivorans]MDH3014510.1 SAM-dependent DNA methyltransferase [Gordonia alkanivorans]MDH3041702.1 SAM-dependent DNA methyltransferase [Gordonia alkanivorans]